MNQPSIVTVLRSAVFYFVMVAWILAWLPFIPILCLLPVERRHPLMTAVWGKVILVILRCCCGIKLHIEGQEHISPTSCIIMSNHQSALETQIYMHFSPQRPVCTLMKQEILWIPVVGWMLRMTRNIAINRANRRQAMQELMQQGQQRLEEGLNILVFPGGTRTAYGKKERYLSGGFRLAELSGTPIQPIAHNAGACWQGFFKYPGVVRVRICPCIAPLGNSNELRALVQQHIESAQNKLAE